MFELICCVLVVVVLVLWCSARRTEEICRIERRYVNDLKEELARLQGKYDEMSKNLEKAESRTHYSRIMGTVRRWALEGRISHEDADEIREWLL